MQKVQDLYQEHMALKFGDLCYKCQTLRDTTPPGEVAKAKSSLGIGKERGRGAILARLF